MKKSYKKLFMFVIALMFLLQTTVFGAEDIMINYVQTSNGNCEGLIIYDVNDVAMGTLTHPNGSSIEGTVTFTATPNPGYEFVGFTISDTIFGADADALKTTQWDGANDSDSGDPSQFDFETNVIDNVITFNIMRKVENNVPVHYEPDIACYLTANFQPIDYNLIIEVDPNEAATYNGGAEGIYHISDSYEVSINDFTINEGWLFDHWSDGTSGITTGGIFSDNDIEVVAYFEPLLPATTVILIEGEGYVVAYDDSSNIINIAKDDTPYVLTYLEKIGDLSYIDLFAYGNEGYTFDHWEYETDMDPNEYDPADSIIDYYMYGDCLAGCTLTATAIFVEAPKLTVQVEAPNTGTVEIDGTLYLIDDFVGDAELLPSFNNSRYTSPQFSSDAITSLPETFSASTKTEWEFSYDPYFIEWLNVTCSAIESEANYKFDHWSVEFWDGNGWVPSNYGFDSTSDTISDFADFLFYEMGTDHVRVTAYFEYDPPYTPPTPKKYTLVIDSTDGGSVNFEGSFTRSSGTIFDIEIIVEEGYEFVKWTGDTDMFNSDGDVVLYKDTSLTAVFEDIQEEVIEEEEDIPESIPEEEEILDIEIPEGPTENPETGGIPLDVFSGAGTLLIGIGAILKKRNRQ